MATRLSGKSIAATRCEFGRDGQRRDQQYIKPPDAKSVPHHINERSSACGVSGTSQASRPLLRLKPVRPEIQSRY